MSHSSIDSRHTALVIIDLQNDFLAPDRAYARGGAVSAAAQALPPRVAAVAKALKAAGGMVVGTQFTVRELWVNTQQRVIGVGYEQPDGTLEHLACDTLILACNGFGGNPAMVRELLPEMRDALFAGHTGNDGSAIRAGWTSTPSAACSGSTASDCPICWPQAAPRGACLATRSGAISPATASSAPWPVATSRRTRRPF